MHYHSDYRVLLNEREIRTLLLPKKQTLQISLIPASKSKRHFYALSSEINMKMFVTILCDICPAICVSLSSALCVCELITKPIKCCNLEKVQFLYTLTLRCAWQFFTSSNKLCRSTTLGAHTYTSSVGFSRITPSQWHTHSTSTLQFPSLSLFLMRATFI